MSSIEEKANSEAEHWWRINNFQGPTFFQAFIDGYLTRDKEAPPKPCSCEKLVEALRIALNQFRHALDGNSPDGKCIVGCAKCTGENALSNHEHLRREANA